MEKYLSSYLDLFVCKNSQKIGGLFFCMFSLSLLSFDTHLEVVTTS
jgi:hypothetical protein